MNKISREEYDKYFRLTNFAMQLVDYFYETRGITIMVDHYSFCECFIDESDYEFTKGDSKCGWVVKYGDTVLSEDNILSMLYQFSNMEHEKLSDNQIDQITAILKLYANTSGVFDNATPFEQVELPYCGTKVSRHQITLIRRKLKAMKAKTTNT